jgi:N-acetyl-gamma-glutamyl-phosphate reductase
VYRVGIVGARGFVGGELLRLLLRHPLFKVSYVTSETQAGATVETAYPALRGRCEVTFAAFEPEEASEAADAFLLARPDGDAMRIAGSLLERGKRVVDISGDFRVRDRARYEHWYRREHVAPELLEQAVYGLPELHSEVRDARLVANPGCYPTAALLAMAPLLAGGLARAEGVVIDAKSGVSGAGGRAGLQEEYSFPAVNENLRAYGVAGHRHTAEIEQELERLAPEAGSVALSFVPHLVPTTRGCYLTCYLPLARRGGGEDIRALYEDFYQHAPFVEYTGAPPEMKQALGTNNCLVHALADDRAGHAICFGAIDNLVKGAAGQAIQNLNLMFRLDETLGLTDTALWP